LGEKSDKNWHMWAKSRMNKQILQDELAFLVEKASGNHLLGQKSTDNSPALVKIQLQKLKILGNMAKRWHAGDKKTQHKLAMLGGKRQSLKKTLAENTTKIAF
jgi:hypothetical protein